MADGTYRERFIEPADPRLGRHVNHDPRSRRFPLPTEGLRIASVQHERHVPIFDQGRIGSCTGNAGIGCLATGVFHETMGTGDAPYWPLDQGSAVRLYSAATVLDPFPGDYPPQDTGSDGLTIAKVLEAAGAISGYLHAFSLDDALKGLAGGPDAPGRPFITGTLWLNDMFKPNTEGLVRPTGRGAGGHEYVGDGYDESRGWVWFTNSWGTGYGRSGRFAMEAEAYGDLLTKNGDVTFFVPSTDTPPTPAPTDSPDDALAEALTPWARKPRGCNRAVHTAAREWLTATGRDWRQ
jgi:hypothetical protein